MMFQFIDDFEMPPQTYHLSMVKLRDFTRRYIKKHKVKPQVKVYRAYALVIPVEEFSKVTPLNDEHLRRKLNKYLTIVKSKGKKYILKNVFWDALIAFLKVETPKYRRLKYCKTV